MENKPNPETFEEHIKHCGCCDGQKDKADEVAKCDHSSYPSDEFCLSDKETSWIKETKWTNEGEDSEPIEWGGRSGFEIEDVKEFITLLKEHHNVPMRTDISHRGTNLSPKYVMISFEDLDKLAGDKLT